MAPATSDVESASKGEDVWINDAEPGRSSITSAHAQYLTARHGTAELDPLPDATDADPYNWPRYKKNINLLLVAFHAFMATFTAASIQSAFENISEDLDVTIQQASYLTSLVICILGVAPLFWRPLSDKYGRRPIFLISLVCSLVGNVGCACSPTYATMGLCRAITAFFISPAAAIGSAVVQETFFKSQRARCMGVWTMFVTLGVPVAPFIFGFVALRVGYRWIYWTLAITNGVQFILYFFLGSESRYIRDPDGAETSPSPLPSGKTNTMFHFRTIDPTPLSIKDLVSPLALAARPCVMIPAVAYAMVFCLANVLPTIEIPQLYVEEFHFNTQQVGLQNIAVIIGTVVGEQFGGFASDWWMAMGTKKNTTNPPKVHPPEFRLWLAYLGYPVSIAGIAVFLVCIGEAGGSWNAAPTVGAGIAAAGNQIVTTVLITYAVDCFRDKAAGIGVFITFVRQIWGFIGPFWFPDMIANAGFAGSTGIAAALIVACSIIPTMLLQWKGAAWH